MDTLKAEKKLLVEKINSIEDQDLLEKIDLMIRINNGSHKEIELTPHHLEMLEMSKQDFNNGNVIAHKELMARNKKWLKEM